MESGGSRLEIQWRRQPQKWGSEQYFSMLMSSIKNLNSPNIHTRYTLPIIFFQRFRANPHGRPEMGARGTNGFGHLVKHLAKVLTFCVKILTFAPLKKFAPPTKIHVDAHANLKRGLNIRVFTHPFPPWRRHCRSWCLGDISITFFIVSWD